MGNLVIAPIRNRGNAVLNDYVYERLNLRSEDRMLEIGFGSAIRREWQWRVARGESLANLQAFAHLFDEKSTEDPG